MYSNLQVEARIDCSQELWQYVPTFSSEWTILNTYRQDEATKNAEMRDVN